MDSGETWKRSNLPEYGNLLAANQNTLYYGGGKALHRSNDAGSIWNPIMYKYVDSAGITSLQIGDNVYLTGSKEDGLFISNDSGETWQQTSIGVGYKVLGLTKVNGQRPVLFALIEDPYTELLYAISSDGIGWSFNETGCLNRSEADSSRELLDEGGKIWLVKCSFPSSLFIVDPQNQTEIVSTIDLQAIATSQMPSIQRTNGSCFYPVQSVNRKSGKAWIWGRLGLERVC